MLSNLTRMAVAANWRGRGVGSALLRAAADEARRMGATKLTLRLRRSLADHRAYFARRGFVVISEGRGRGAAAVSCDGVYPALTGGPQLCCS
jgi:predicted N-acetyltransferase YhbS